MNRFALVSIGLAVMLVVLLVAASSMADSAAQIAAAQAAIEAARAAQIAAGGQAVSSGLLTLVVLVLGVAILALLGGIGYLVYERRAGRSRWVPGPNAHWQTRPQPPALRQPDALQQLVQLEMLRYLRDGQKLPPVPPQYALPVQRQEAKDEFENEWGL